MPLSHEAQCESLRFKLIGGLAVRRACYGVLRCVLSRTLLVRNIPKGKKTEVS